MNVYAFLLLICLFLLSACKKEEGIGSFDDVVIESPANSNKIRQLSLIVSLKNKDQKYINIASIDSLKLNVNGEAWGIFNSQTNDTTGRTRFISNGLKLSDAEISYLVIAPYVLKTDNLSSLGDYVEYLKNRIVLAPGDYVCEISEIKFKDEDEQWVVVKPQVFKDFKVIENTASSFIGEITINLNR